MTSLARSPLGPALFAVLLLASAGALGGCGAQKAVESPKVAKKPVADELRTVNGDILYGRLEEQRFSISSPLLKRVTFERAEIREITLDDDEDTIRTRRGDLVRGRVEPRRFRFKADVGVSKEFLHADLTRIQLGS